jgi:hypothetical protein
MNEMDKQFQLNELLLLSLEGDITPEQVDRLNQWIIDDPSLAAGYLDFIGIYSELSPHGDMGHISVPEESSETQLYDRLLQSLAAEEETAPQLDLVVPAPPQQAIIQKVDRQKGVYKLSRSSLLTFIVSAAAILFIAVFLYISPTATTEVATLTDSIDAVFAGGRSPVPGGRLLNRPTPVWLQKGILKIKFDYGAEVVIEGPAQFTLNSAETMTLHSGRLFAHVPSRSKGFKVETPIAAVIDLGTAFGVKVDFDGTSDIHLFTGKASLIPGAKGQTGEGQILTSGQARCVDPAGQVAEMAVRQDAFVRDIDSQTGLVWRGQPHLDLADIVTGGNGFGGGNPMKVIDPENGRVMDYVQRGSGTRMAASSFSRVDALSYIDGVFVPNGGQGPVVVSSAGTLFAECPKTSGGVRKDICVLNKVYESEGDSLAVGELAFGYPQRPAISMHANIGITVDLEAIRKDLPAFDITYFEAVCAIAASRSAAGGVQLGRADFWILIDGQVRKSVAGAPIGFFETVRIPLQPSDRFLTLMTTDHLESAELDPIHSDRCFFGDPVLGIVPAER